LVNSFSYQFSAVSYQKKLPEKAYCYQLSEKATSQQLPEKAICCQLSAISYQKKR